MPSKNVLGLGMAKNVHNTENFSRKKFKEISVTHSVIKKKEGGFPGGAVVKNLPVNAGDAGSSPGLGRSHMPRSN